MALELVFSFVVFVDVTEATDATDAKLSGRSLASPLAAPCAGGENEEGGGGGELTSDEDGAGEALGVALTLANGLANGKPGDPLVDAWR